MLTPTASTPPCQMAYDSTGHILYAASWNAGLLALKLSP
jgi:hypothetical protein